MCPSVGLICILAYIEGHHPSVLQVRIGMIKSKAILEIDHLITDYLHSRKIHEKNEWSYSIIPSSTNIYNQTVCPKDMETRKERQESDGDATD